MFSVMHLSRLCCVAQVLYLTEPIDEVAIQNLAEYNDKKFVDVSREGIDLGADDEDSKKKVSMLYRFACEAAKALQSPEACTTWQHLPTNSLLMCPGKALALVLMMNAAKRR